MEPTPRGDGAPGAERALLEFVRDLRRAVLDGNDGRTSHPYRRGSFLVAARAGDVEITISDVSEEDAVLVASELRSLGARAVLRGAVRCPACGARVPEQERCVRCRTRLRRR